MVSLHDIMTLDVLTVSPETTLREAAALFADEYVSGAPAWPARRSSASCPPPISSISSPKIRECRPSDPT